MSPDDFSTALFVCTSAVVSVDLTPLLAAFCPHASSNGEESLVSAPLDTPTLTGLLEGVVGRQAWRTAVRMGPGDEENVFFQSWGDDTRRAVGRTLIECGFVGVPDVSGYYHWREQLSNRQEEVREVSDTHVICMHTCMYY